MLQIPVRCIVDLPDDLWREVFLRLDSPTTLTNLCAVSRRFRRLSTADEIFRAYVLLRTGSERSKTISEKSETGCGGTALGLSWRAQYRALVALHRSTPTAVRNFSITSSEAHLSLLAVFEPGTVVLHQRDADLIVCWPSSWSICRRDICNWDVDFIQSAVITLGNASIGFVNCPTGAERNWTLAIVDMQSGRRVRDVALPCHDSALSTTWTKEAVHHAPIVLCAGPHASHVVYCTTTENVVVVDTDAGTVCRVWEQVSDPFSMLVRGPCCGRRGSFCILGIVSACTDGSNNRYEVQNIISGDCITKFELARNETLIDVLIDASTDADLKFVACRILTGNSLVISLTLARNRNGTWTNRRDVLAKSMTLRPKGTAEFEMLEDGRGIFYRPEGSLRFYGSIRVLARHESEEACYTVHTLTYARAGGAAIRWARLSADGCVLFSCAYDSGIISIFDLDAGGRCRASLRTQAAVLDVAVLSDHVILALTSEENDNARAFHFGRFCNTSLDCLSPAVS